MLRLHSGRFAVAVTSQAIRRSPVTCCGTSLKSLPSVARRLVAVSPVLFSSSTTTAAAARRFFSQAPPSADQRPFPSHTTTFSSAPTRAPSRSFLRGARASSASFTPSFASLRLQLRTFRVKGQDSASTPKQDDANAQEQTGEGEEKAKAEGENTEEKNAGKGNKKEKKGKGAPKKKSFMDHIYGLREDYAKFPDIYNSANAINFAVFTIFCLCSTGSNTEENWWMTHWGLDNSFRPWTWVLHSFLTNNFLSMTYAMMLLHTMCHHVLPTLGSRGLLLYVGSTAVISGATMWLGNYLYYGNTAAPEKQFGPWDVVSALFVMEYFYYGLTPMTILNSFSSWIKYAVWVGQLCILYFDWQPTVVGTLVGLALCRGVPRFKAVKAAAAGAK